MNPIELGEAIAKLKSDRDALLGAAKSLVKSWDGPEEEITHAHVNNLKAAIKQAEERG